MLLEACLRNLDGFVIDESHVKALAGYDARNVGEVEIPFLPGRVVLQDFTGVPGGRGPRGDARAASRA